jgi:acetyl-CoA acetyltransferase
MFNLSRRLCDQYAIVGTATSDLGRTSLDSQQLLEQAMRRALDDAGLEPRDVDGIVCRGPDDVYAHHQHMGQRLGIDARFSTSLDNGGASQILAIVLAVMAIDAGLCSTVVCGYGRNSWGRTHADAGAQTAMSLVPQEQLATEFGPEYGYFGAVATHAFGARRHMHEYGTRREDFGEVAMAFREHALRNPDAVMKKPLTLEDYLGARMIADPYGLYDCSLVSDGAGAVVVTSSDRAYNLRQRPVFIKGFGTFNNLTGWLAGEHMVRTAAVESGKTAFEMAGISPAEIDTAQIYDCFTGMVIAQLEDYGFCPKGEGGPFVRSGALRLGGLLPTNTSGGQLSEAHVEGMLQIVEAVRQLRHTYPDERQVPGAQHALVSGHGGNTVCHSTLILSR